MGNRRTSNQRWRHILACFCFFFALFFSHVRQHVYLWFIVMIFPADYGCFLSVQPSDEVINCALAAVAIKIRDLMREHRRERTKAAVRVLGKQPCGAAHLPDTGKEKKKKGWMRASTGLGSQATCNLTGPFPQTHTQAQAHSTLNDPHPFSKRALFSIARSELASVN